MPHVRQGHARAVCVGAVPGANVEDEVLIRPGMSSAIYRRYIETPMEVRDFLHGYLRTFHDLGMTLDEAVLTQMMDTAERRFEEETGRRATPIPWVPSTAPAHDPVVYYLLFDAMVKIGTTTNIRQRLENLPHDRLLAVEWGSRKVEQGRHEQFARFRRKGEWFRADQVLLNHAATVRTRFEEYVAMDTESWMQHLLAR